MLYTLIFKSPLLSIMLIVVLITLCLWIQRPVLATPEVINKEKQGTITCNRDCGNIDIRYPFGIGVGCFYNESFSITCNYSSSSHVPVLKVLDLEVIEIPYVYDQWTGVLTVRTPLVTTCNGGNNTSNNSDKAVTEAWWSSPDMSHTPFNLYEYDVIFASVGCDGYAMMYNETGGFVTGCSSVCSPNPALKGLNKTKCIGYGCCVTEFEYSSSLKGYTIGVKVDKGSGSCRSAFLTSKEYYLRATNASLLESPMSATAIPVQLRWNIDRVYTPSGGSDVDWGLALYIVPSGGTLLITCVIIWLCWFSKTQKRRKEIRLRAKYFKKRLQEQRSIIQKTKLFTRKELNKATDNFSKDRILGKGGQGTVYKGMLVDGEVVAIKKSTTFDEPQWKEFVNEVILLSQIKHRHVVKLLGCCLETKEPLLVYEFIANGTLFEHIHDSTKEFSLSWQMRVRIASEIANAISYLHSGSPTPIFHRDIKSSNILLDDKYMAKVSDFGISRAVTADQTHLTTCVQGTFGYLDPEYFRFSQFSEKSDVFSFGVVLVELLTGQKPIRSTTLEGGEEEEVSLVEYFIASLNDSSLYSILDPTALKSNAEEHVMTVANLAKECLNPRGALRPTMKEVVIVLDGLAKEQK